MTYLKNRAQKLSRKPPTNDYEAWKVAELDDLWVFDKLIVARKAGHICGPRGMRVPKPDFYILRPICNFEGMGQGAYIDYLEYETVHIPHGYFWCEIFVGEHLSVDYRGFSPVLSVIGTRDEEQPLQRFSRWEKTDSSCPLPQMLVRMCLRYQFINCEFVGNKLIEVHLRGNPDFAYGNTLMIPVWPGQSTIPPEGFRFIADTDEADRVGIFVN